MKEIHSNNKKKLIKYLVEAAFNVKNRNMVWHFSHFCFNSIRCKHLKII